MLIIIPILIVIGLAIYGLREIINIRRKLKGLEGQIQFFALQIEQLQQEKKQEIKQSTTKKKSKYEIIHHPQLGDFAREIKG